MIHLKPYNIFESSDSLRVEVRELLANLEDDGFIVTFSYMGKDNGYIYIKKPPLDKKPGIPGWDQNQFFRADEVRGDIIRLCDFLDDRYLCDVNIVGAGSMIRAKPVTRYQFEKHESKIYAIRINLFSKRDDVKS